MDHLSEPGWSKKLRELAMPVPDNRRVLLVDDDPDNLTVLRALLEDEFEVYSAPGGREALEAMAKIGETAVVLTDQRMPGMTGVELLAEVAMRDPQAIRMILTAYSDLPPIAAAAKEGGVYRFLFKPWQMHDMRLTIRQAAWLYNARAALRQLAPALAARRDHLAATLDQIRRSEADLLAAERLGTLGRFTSGITHNIRNSLTVMATLLELVQQAPGEQRVLDSAQMAFRSLDALLRMVSDVNALARGEQHEANRALVEVESFVEQMLAIFRLEAAGRGRQVRTTMDERSRVLAFDPSRVQHALLVLLRNAAHALATPAPLEVSFVTAQGGEEDGGNASDSGAWRTTITVGASETTAAGSLADGPPRAWGAAPSRPASDRAGGLDLGLEICRMVAESHGGRLSVRAEGGDAGSSRIALELAMTRPPARGDGRA